MSNAIISMQTLNLATKHTFKDQNLAKATARIASIYDNALAYADDKNREIAKILSEVKVGKFYEKDGYKSVADYAHDIFGLQKQNAYSLASAGDIYNDPKASDAVKAISPSKLAELSNVPRETLDKAIMDGKISATTTQKDLRQFAKDNTPEKPQKGRVLPMYTIRGLSHSPIDYTIEYCSEHKTMDEWDECIATDILSNFSPKRPVEIVNISKCAPFKNPLSDEKSVVRHLYITEDIAMVIEFYKVENPRKNGKVKTIQEPKRLEDYSIDELAARLEELKKQAGADTKK